MYILRRRSSGLKYFFHQAGRKALVLFLLGIFVVSAASAQKGRPKSRSGDAVLHIHVHVVPVVMTPRPRQKNVSSGVVTYDITTSQPSVETIETTTLLPGGLVGSGGGGGAGSGIVVLKTFTIVAK